MALKQWPVVHPMPKKAMVCNYSYRSQSFADHSFIYFCCGTCEDSYVHIIIGIERDVNQPQVNRVLTYVDIKKRQAKEIKTTSYYTDVPVGQGAQNSVLTDDDKL